MCVRVFVCEGGGTKTQSEINEALMALGYIQTVRGEWRGLGLWWGWGGGGEMDGDEHESLVVVRKIFMTKFQLLTKRGRGGGCAKDG